MVGFQYIKHCNTNADDEKVSVSLNKYKRVSPGKYKIFSIMYINDIWFRYGYLEESI